LIARPAGRRPSCRPHMPPPGRRGINPSY
jgi:hypothetical protein